MTEAELRLIVEQLQKGLAYIPIVYKQSRYTGDQENYNNVFMLEFKQSELPSDSLLFFIPSVSSTNNADSILRIRIPVVENGVTVYKETDYKIVVEQNDDLPRPAKLGDIIAERMCIFRFRKESKKAILCNSPLYNDAVYGSIKATDAVFLNPPRVMNNENPSQSFVLIDSKTFNALEERVAKLENRIVYGTQEPEEALADYPAGTVYIQYEKD